jgi:uncharacterized LabA/DUF88 family protein
MVRLLATDYVLQRVYYVDAINERDANTKKKQEAFFYGVLRDQLGYEVLIRPLQFPGGQPTQKGTDTLVSITLAGKIAEFDVAVLLAADSDFVPAVELVTQQQKVVRNAHFRVRPSFHLTQACNGPSIIMDDLDCFYHRDNPKELFTLTSKIGKEVIV